MIAVAILGHGVVGSGVAELLTKNADKIGGKAGQAIVVRRILDLREFPDCPYAEKFTKNFEEIVNDDAIRIVVETMGGLHPAYEFTKRCLEAGKSVVTSNKELVAAKGDELLRIARENNLNFLFEASVGGGIPILRPIDQCLAANEVDEIAGILNGTTNFMLTKMFAEGMSFDEALALAQERGYAERDPSADVGGHDACRKICILAALAFGKHVYPEQIHTEGITSITGADVRCAAAWGGAIKLIGRAIRQEDGRLYGIVAPMLVPKACPLSMVGDVFNAILVHGDAVGNVMFYGPGAGKMPTASAVVADVIDEVKHLKARKFLYWEAGEPSLVTSYLDRPVSMLLRLRAESGSSIRPQLDTALAGWQPLAVDGLPAGEQAIITPVLPERELRSRLDGLEGCRIENAIRIADFR